MTTDRVPPGSATAPAPPWRTTIGYPRLLATFKASASPLENAQANSSLWWSSRAALTTQSGALPVHVGQSARGMRVATTWLFQKSFTPPHRRLNSFHRSHAATGVKWSNSATRSPSCTRVATGTHVSRASW